MKKQDIPDIEIIDLDDTNLDDASQDPGDTPSRDAGKGDSGADVPGKASRGLRLNMHLVLLAMTIITFSFILYRYINWGQVVEFGGADRDYLPQNYDSILPLTDADENIITPNLEDGLSIAIFGNDPFAAGRDSGNDLAAMLADATGADIYNCSIAGSYMASVEVVPDVSLNAWDSFSFYWMTLFATGLLELDYFDSAVAALGTNAPAQAADVRETFSTLDLRTVDVIVVMYDAADYFAGRPAYETQEIPSVQSFAGNLGAGIDTLRDQCPNTRIIVLSPTYAFSDQTDEDGDYISSDIVHYGEDVLSTYVGKEAEACSLRNVTFVDNFYVTFNEDTAADYLRDHRSLNEAGQKAVVDRLVYALNYFSGITSGTTSSTAGSR